MFKNKNKKIYRHKNRLDNLLIKTKPYQSRIKVIKEFLRFKKNITQAVPIKYKNYNLNKYKKHLLKMRKNNKDQIFKTNFITEVQKNKKEDHFLKLKKEVL